jgi:adenine phosphoribosyltransferase
VVSPTERAGIDRLLDLVRAVPDYPEPGVTFRDITPLLADGQAFRAAVVEIAARAAEQHGPVDVVAGMEARGFILGAALATHIGVGFVPLRKAGKLPPPVETVSYDLEYGRASLELRSGTLTAGSRVLIIDDVLATGGTASAAARLVAACGGTVVGMAFLLEIAGLGGREALAGHPVDALLVTPS